MISPLQKSIILPAFLFLLTTGSWINAAPSNHEPGAANNVKPCAVKLDTPAANQVVFDQAAGFPIAGTVTQSGVDAMTVRVTTSQGAQSFFQVPIQGGAFSFDLKNAKDESGQTLPWVPSLLYVDFLLGDKTSLPEKEMLYILVDKKAGTYPEIVTPFTSGLRDDRGQVDAKSLTFPLYQKLVDLFMGSRNADYYGFRNVDFDLAHPADLHFFKENLTMYDCAYGDQFKKPTGMRVARTFWYSTYLSWFDDSNTDRASAKEQAKYGFKYRPYVFSNDYCDILISTLCRLPAVNGPAHENLDTVVSQGVSNLLAMQHTNDDDRALGYGTGSFYFGMFYDGKPMLKGTGWFRNPASSDYYDGGVFSGRTTWALGIYLKMAPDSEIKPKVADALRAAVKWCLFGADHLVSQQTKGFLLLKRSPHGYRYWRDPGEQGYMLLGMLAALEKYPDLMVIEPTKTSAGVSLRSLTIECLNGLSDALGDQLYWSQYANVDSEAVASLAIGSRQLANDPHAPAWGEAANKVALGWCKAQDPHHPGDLTHFGLRLSDGIMTCHIPGISDGDKTNSYFGYQDGHWLQALVEVERIHPNPVFEARMSRLVGYMAGNNAFNVRILNEMGWVNNWEDDLGDTGKENYLKYDPYPESTCFFQIGLYEYLRWAAQTPVAAK